jgi:hypothetical protein
LLKNSVKHDFWVAPHLPKNPQKSFNFIKNELRQVNFGTVSYLACHQEEAWLTEICYITSFRLHKRFNLIWEKRDDKCFANPAQGGRLVDSTPTSVFVCL